MALRFVNRSSSRGNPRGNASDCDRSDCSCPKELKPHHGARNRGIRCCSKGGNHPDRCGGSNGHSEQFSGRCAEGCSDYLQRDSLSTEKPCANGDGGEQQLESKHTEGYRRAGEGRVEKGK